MRKVILARHPPLEGISVFMSMPKIGCDAFAIFQQLSSSALMKAGRQAFLVVTLLLIRIAALRAADQMQAGSPDWLVVPVTTPSRVEGHESGKELVLGNGLISRTFRTGPNLGTVSFKELSHEAEYLRAVSPEASVTINGQRWEIGGLAGQPDHSYLDPAWLAKMTTRSNAFQYSGYRIGKPEARYPWRPRFGAPPTSWPPKGVSVTFDFKAPGSAAGTNHVDGVTASVHYEIYDGLPVLAKWITLSNGGSAEIVLEKSESELLAVTPDQRRRLVVDCDQLHAAALNWVSDPDWRTFAPLNPGDARFLPHPQQYLLRCEYQGGPAAAMAPGQSFESYRTYELLLDSDDSERRGLAHRRMYRTLTPQATENPIFMHLAGSDSKSIRRAVDQCAAVGFEMVILTFWSGFNMESEDPAYIARIKADFDYAHSKGIKIGGYILFATTASKGPANDAIDPVSLKPNGSLCLASAFTDRYFAKLFRFIDATGMDVIETDGPYHGYECASTEHKYHRGRDDSRRVQWERQGLFYKGCLDRGLYINSPEWYFFQGSNKYPMGYREENWSLPRNLQILIGRQNIYDGTFDKTPSMGWMMLPLTQYHGGGAAATIEPLREHLDVYEAHLAQNFGSGVIACYRGPRLFDTEETEALVRKWTDFYKRYRDILDSDIIHVRRPDGRDIDCMLHVNPGLQRKGLAMVYNPLETAVSRNLTLPLCYTGLKNRASIRQQEGAARSCAMDAKGNATVSINMAPKSATWFVVESGE